MPVGTVRGLGMDGEVDVGEGKLGVWEGDEVLVPNCGLPVTEIREQWETCYVHSYITRNNLKRC